MKKYLAGLLVAATALTPLSAAHAQRENRENVREDRGERVPRGPEVRQWNRGERPAPAPETRRSDDRPRSEWRGPSSTDSPRRPRQDAPRQDQPQPQRGNPGGNYDRNGDGRIDRQWDRNDNGRVDQRWDRNDNGRVDRQWDRNRNGELDRRWDRNNDERLDRRYDHNRDGRADRYRHDDRRYRHDDQRYGHGGWNRSWRNDRRYNWHGYRDQYRDHYRLGRYYAPHYNHRYSRFSIGIRIGTPFYSSRYWINDPWRYRLPDVYGSYRWVRYYDDVLLVDTYSGEVVDVIHNFFW